MRRLFAACLAVTCLAGAGCAPLQPYRTEPPSAAYDPARHDCDATRDDPNDASDIGGKVDARCATRIREDASNYRLYFTEFDDQGWAYPGDAPYGAAGQQIGIFVDELKRSLAQSDERVSRKRRHRRRRCRGSCASPSRSRRASSGPGGRAPRTPATSRGAAP